MIYVARQMRVTALEPRLCAPMGMLIDELEDAPKLSAEAAIRAARATDVSVLCLAEQGA